MSQIIYIFLIHIVNSYTNLNLDLEYLTKLFDGLIKLCYHLNHILKVILNLEKIKYYVKFKKQDTIQIIKFKQEKPSACVHIHRGK